MATYGMKNAVIKESNLDGIRQTFLVYADSDRFGKHEIMYQSPTLAEAETWLQGNGIDVYRLEVSQQKTVAEMVEEEAQKPFGKIQIGNAMYRNLHREDGKLCGYSHRNGWTELDKYFANATATGSKTAKATIRCSNGYNKNLTIKFGNACTW